MQATISQHVLLGKNLSTFAANSFVRSKGWCGNRRKLWAGCQRGRDRVVRLPVWHAFVPDQRFVLHLASPDEFQQLRVGYRPGLLTRIDIVPVHRRKAVVKSFFGGTIDRITSALNALRSCRVVALTN